MPDLTRPEWCGIIDIVDATREVTSYLEREVVGSNPAVSTHGDVAQFGRALKISSFTFSQLISGYGIVVALVLWEDVAEVRFLLPRL